MSFRLDLDEMPARQLLDELASRRKMRRNGLCDYCGRAPDTPSCKFPERHKNQKVKEPLLMRFMRYLRDNNRKPGVLSEHELRDIIVEFRQWERSPRG